MITTKIIISINVHEKISFLHKQLTNISNFMIDDYYIILNCNEYMFNELKNETLASNIIINPNYFNKERFTGLLTKGIVYNIEYALTNFIFEYFIIMSSREFFYNNLALQNLIDLPYASDTDSYIGYKHHDFIDLNTWHWPIFQNTLLYKYFYNGYIASSPHEGLVFDYETITKIITFLNSNENIKLDIFNTQHCCEEFALQTISVNIGHGFKYIGNGTCDFVSDPLKYTYKIIRN